MKKIVQLSIFFVLYLSAFQIDAQSFTQFRGLGSDNSAGTGFKTISTNSVLVVSNNATGTTNSVVGSELFSKLTTAGGTDVITLKADGVNSISFDVNDMSIFNFLDPASAADYTTNTKIVFKNSVGTIIRTMTLNATKSLTSSTSGVSIGAFFDNNASLPVTGVSEIEITINPSTVSVDAFTIRNITLNNIVSGAVPSGPATLNFNALGITNTISNTLGKSTAIGPLNFEINSAATNDLITFKSNEGAGGTGALYDNNQDIGGITKWTISRHDGSEFTLSSIYLQEAGVGASTSGTLKARRNGAQVGSTVNVTFNGSIDVSGNPNFSNIDEVWIEAADINFYLDNVAYVIPSTVVTPTLTTSAATSITASGATLNGNVSADGGASVSARGFVYSISDNTPTIGESGVTNVSDGSGTGTFSEAITGLTASTTYYYQAYATNSVGTSYGGVESFGTSAESSSSAIITFDGKGYIDNQDLGNPYTIDSNGETFKFTVSGGVPTSNRYRTTDTWGCNNTGFGDLTAGINTATTWTIEIVSGNEIDLGTIKFNNLFNCYAFTYNLSIEGFKNNSSTGSQSFSVAGMNSIFTPNSSFDDVDKVVITGTDIANLGMDDINWASMATSNTAPTLSTSAASSITATSSTLGGNVTADGGAAVTARGFVYSTSDNTPTIGESGVTNVSDGSGTGVFSEAITGLTASTTYYYQAYATNSVGTSYGGVESFITASSGPIVTDSNISISGASGTGGAFKIGDTVTASWNNTNGGDNNSDVISSVTIDFSQFGGGSAVAATNSSDTWTATYTITAGAIDAFNRNVSVTATNNSSLATTTADTSNARVDNQLPTSTIVVADTQLTAGETSQVTITFSEAVTGFSSADLTVANGSLSGLSSSDGGITWTATLTPSAGITDATNLITLDNTGVADQAGNAGSGTTNSNNYAIDNQRPTATIVVADTQLTAGETSQVTITFSEAVTGFSSADLTVANGSLSGLSSSDGGITWTATLTPSAGITDATNLINLDNTGVADQAGNTGSGTTNSNNYAIDNQRPTATIVVADTQLTAGETSQVTFTFSEAVTGFSSADLTVANGSLSGLSSSDGGITWTATLTPSAGITDATNLITLDNTGVADQAGNAGSGTTNSNNYAIDNQRPTATIVVADTQLTAGETSQVTITFSEAVTGFSSADLTVANGSLSGLSSSDGGITWTATLTPSAGITDATNLITLDNTGVADQAGNAGSGTTNSNNYAIDNQRPTAIIVVADTQLTAGETSQVTITFSEAVTGFSSADLTVANGSLSGLSSSDGGITWTATLTPSAGITDATNLITLDNTGVADQAGNTGSGTTNSNNYAIDNVAPTVTDPEISISGASGTGGAFKIGDTVTATWNNTADGDNNSDVISSVTINFSQFGGESAVAATNSSGIWTATYTITAGAIDASNRNISVTANDSAGNATTTADTSNATVDNIAPSVSVFSPLNSAIEVALQPTLTITFDQEVTLGNAGIFKLGKVGEDACTIESIIEFDLSDSAVKSLFVLSEDKLTLSLEITENLPLNTQVIMEIPAGFVSDAVGNSFAGFSGYSYTWSFTTITKNSQMITFPEIGAKTYGDPTFTLGNAETDRGLTVTYTAADPTVVNITGNQATILKAGSTTITATQEGDESNFAAMEVERTLTVGKKALTITANNDSKTYGSTYSFAGTEFSTEGLTNDDAVTSATISSAGAAATAAADTYDILISEAVGTGLNNYAITYEKGTLTVGKKALTITANNDSKTYGSTYSFADTEFSTEGLTNDDEVTSATISSAGAAAAAAVDTYDILISEAVGTGLDNYQITYEKGTLTVGKKALTITANNDSKTYGSTYSFAGTEFSTEGLTNDDAVTSTTISSAGAAATAAVDTYDILISEAVGTGLNNYAITYEKGTLTVGKKALTITANNDSKTYGSTYSFAGTEFSTEGLTNEDEVTSATISSAGAAATAAVDTYDILISEAVGTGLDNYEITYGKGTLTVGKKALTITANNDSKTYGSTYSFAGTEFSIEGLTNDDEVTSATISSAGAAATAAVDTYDILISEAVGTGLDNYEITYEKGTLTVGKKALTITADNKSKTYGEANPTLTFSYDGLTNGDEKVATEPSIATTATASSNVGTYPITLTGGMDQNYTITLVNGTLTIGKKEVTITADNKSKTYGEANPTLTFSYDGLTNGDEKVATEPSIATTATASSNVGTYPITLTGGIDQNYTITLVNGTLTIGKKEVTITADNKSKTYGEANPSLTFSYDGLTNGDEKVATEPSIATTATASSNVGAYPITLTGGMDQNYTITLVNGTLTIGKKEVTITAGNKSKTYGEVNPTLTFSYAGLVNGDTKVTNEPSIATTATASSNVGAYPITLTGGMDQNYTITLVNGTLTIGKKEVTITAGNKSKTYGEVNPTLTFSYAGLVNGDTKVTNEPSIATTATASSNVGTYPITLSGGMDQNYTITLVNGTLTVGKKALTITADNKSKTYGEANPTLTFSYAGLVNGDTKVTNEPSISTTATASSNVGTYPITLTGGIDQNYTITLVNGTLTIGKKEVTITADDKSKTYGEANPTLTFSYDGLTNGDEKVATEPSIATTATASSNVGTYPITLTGGMDQNYTITLVNGTLTIGKKEVTITADNKSKTYGEANPTLTFSYDGLVNGDTKVTNEPSIATTATASSNVGTYPITLTGGTDQNYTITLVNGTLTIGKKEVIITADNKSKTYGEANPTLTFSYDGLTNGDEKVATEPSIATTATASSNVGTYPITLTGGTDQNYTITLVNGTLTIGKKEVTITADNKSKTYGEVNPTLTFSYAGLVNGDTKVTNEPSISTTATASSNVGAYPITLTGGTDQNYTIALVNGTLTIGKKEVTITAGNKSKTYGEVNPTLTFSYAGLVNGDTKVTNEPSIATTATASSNVGTYPITLTGGTDQNYTITLVNGTLTIGKKEVTITADNKSKTYGEVNPTLTFSYDGLVNGDTKVTNEPSISTTATASSNVGTYPITLTGGMDQNYTITMVNGTLTVTKATLKIQANAHSKIFGSSDPELTFIATGFKGTDNITSLTGKLSREAGELVGSYKIVLGTLIPSNNYEVEYFSAQFEIIPAELITISDHELITTPWSVSPSLPINLSVVTADGQVVQLPVTWDQTPLNIFKRGAYFLTGKLTLPSGILNPAELMATVEVNVLAKPAPQDVILSNNDFDPDPANYFQEIGSFTVIDPIDNVHSITLLPGAGDNEHFEVKSGILFWSSADEVSGKTEFTVVIQVADRDGNVIEKQFTINRGRTDIMELEIFNSFTPNGDGINDTWGVPDLRYYIGVRVQVFDRNSERMFYTEDADVRWDGTYKGKEMPVGTYFWVVEVIETGIIRRGILTILKD